MRKKLTAKSVDALPPATVGKRYEVRDELLPGLTLRVGRNGSKVWYVTARVAGRSRRIKIGSYPVVSLADARDKARDLLRDVQLGKHGQADEPKAPKLGTVVEDFIELYAKPRNKDWKGTQGILGKFAALNGMPIDQMKRQDVIRVLDGIVASGTPVRANRALAAIKKLFAWSLDRGTIEVNPIAGLKAPAREVARDRVLTDAELIACWRAAEDEGFPFGPLLQLLILTGQRRGEVAGMRWSEIDLDRGVWTLPAKRAKNAQQHVVPLSQPALVILRSLPRFLNSDFVLTTTGKTPVSGFGRLKARMDDITGAEDWRLHDVRRTVATNMAIMGVQPHVIEAVLNHRTGIVSGVAAVYNRYAYMDEKREALTAWARRIEELTNPKLEKKTSRRPGRGSEPARLSRLGVMPSSAMT